MSYYVVQKLRGDYNSAVDVQWRSDPLQTTDLQVALARYREITMEPSDYDIRLVKAFYCQNLKTVIVREVLHYQTAKQRV